MTRNPQWELVRQLPPQVGFWRRLGRAIAGLFVSRRYYEGGKASSRFREFGRQAAGPNTISQAEGKNLRDRCRDMTRNDPHFARAVAVHVNNIVGTGIVATATTAEGLEQDAASIARAQKANAIWKARGRRGVCDAEGQHTRDALIQLAVRGMKESGEVLMRRIVDRTAPLIPYRYELLEADLLDAQKNGVTESGGRIVQGVELNQRGRRVAYWILPEHPGEGGALGMAMSMQPSVRVPAADMLHLFVPLRPRQLRGIPLGAPVLHHKRDLADYEGNELLRKKTEAAVVAFVIPSDGMEGDADGGDDGIAPTVVDADGKLIETLEPGLIARLRRGKEVRFNQPIIPGGYAENKRALLQDIAVGFGVSYEQVTGDLSQANYSSLRAGLLEFWRGIEMDQWTYVIPVLCDRLWQWEMEGAYLVGLLDQPEIPVEWSAPRRQSVDPSKDTLADVLDVRALFVPLEDKIAERGYEPKAAMSRIAAFNDVLDGFDKPLISDADPRKTAFRGASSPATTSGATPLTGDGTNAGDGGS